jgi:hypothetical protein
MEQPSDSVYIDGMTVHRQKASNRRINAGLFIGLLLYLGSNAAYAQSQPPRMEKFETDAPKVGEMLPDITVLDDLGNPVNIRQLASENYKVLVLGCLT